MWRSPTTPPDEAAEAGRPRRSRWLDIVNLAVSVLILAIFVRMIPLLTAGSGHSLNDLAFRVDSLERSVAAIQAQVAAPPGQARLELAPVDAAGFHGLGRFTGFRIRNTGTETASNIRALVILSGVSPGWAGVLTSTEQLAVRTFPASVAVSIRRTEASSPLANASGSGATARSALELTVAALAPGQTLYVALGLSPELTARTCAVAQSTRVEVRPSRFSPPGMPSASLEALQYDFAGQLRTQVESRGRVAQFAALAVCDNCRDPAGAGNLNLSALAGFSVVGGEPRQGKDDAWEWDVEARAEFYAPAGIAAPCDAAARLFDDSFAFVSHAGRIYLYDVLDAESQTGR